jgi:antitoxin component YwqK of YwqJK toxin-antitoxin module
MKIFNISFIVLPVLLLTYGCTGKGSLKKESKVDTDTVTVPDTGYTGIKKFYNQDRLLWEVNFKNGIRQGEMKTYYQGGQLYQTYWYENGLREDSARWYYLEGQLFRSTPMMHDTVDGTQIQYYRNGRKKAEINYIKGFRTPLLKEYTRDGKLISIYPEIAYSINDNYKSTGKVRINLEITDKTRKVKFYRGEFTNGVFDTTKVKRIKPVNGKTFLDLKKSGTPQADSISIIAAIVTDFGNNYLNYKKIGLPYKDLK